MLTAQKLQEIMSGEGPVVNAVVLRQNGTTEAVEIDFTPSKNHLAQVMNGRLAIIGEFPVIRVVAMVHSFYHSGAHKSQHVGLTCTRRSALNRRNRSRRTRIRCFSPLTKKLTLATLSWSR